MKKGISVIGVPMWLGQTRFGPNMGPEAIRAAGLMSRLRALSYDAIDMGNIAIGGAAKVKTHDKTLKNLNAIVAASKKIAAKVAGIAASNRFPLILGGDHSMSIGTLAGISKKFANLGVIWYDAHADMNTPETTPSGNIHGMPLAASMGIGHSSLTGVGGYIGKVKPENVVLIGARDIDPGERDFIRDKNIKVYTAEDVYRLGIEQVIAETIEYLGARCDGVHLSFDMDGIDPFDAPGVGTPVSEGITSSESLLAMRLLAESGIITSAEFVELNPLLDKEDRTALTAVAMMSTLLGETGLTELTYPAQQVSGIGDNLSQATVHQTTR